MELGVSDRPVNAVAAPVNTMPVPAESIARYLFASKDCGDSFKPVKLG